MIAKTRKIQGENLCELLFHIFIGNNFDFI